MLTIQSIVKQIVLLIHYLKTNIKSETNYYIHTIEKKILKLFR